MATGNSLEEDFMEIAQCFFTPETGQEWTLREQVNSAEQGPSMESLLNIASDELAVFKESLPQPDFNEDAVMQDHLLDPNALNTTLGVSDALHYSYKPFVEIIEQPAPRSLRFRYECEIEGRSAGSLVGVSTTAEVRTHPTIKVMNYQGPYVVVVSCVTKDGPPYRPHPHNLVGKEGCKRGVCTLTVNSPDMKCSFTSLGIQCVRKRDIGKSYKVRQKYNCDPFSTGFSHRGNIDLSVLRLCFQVFIPGRDGPKPLAAVVSEPIHDKKAVSDLTIMKLSHCSAPASGGTNVILLCDRVAKEDIQVWFYETQGTSTVWESKGTFQPSDVHKQVAISFLTPPYRNQNIQQSVSVFIELRKPSDNTRGEPREFNFLPVEKDPEGIAHKKRKIIEKMKEYLEGDIETIGSMSQGHQTPICVPRTMRQPVLQRIKEKPRIGPNINEDPFAQSSTPFTECFNSTFLPTVPVSIGGPSTSPHLTQTHLPALATSPGPHNCAPTIPPPIMQQTVHQTESPESNNINEAHWAEEDAIVQKFDSLDLDFDVNMAQNLSASLFDSALNIPNVTYHDDQSANDQQ